MVRNSVALLLALLLLVLAGCGRAGPGSTLAVRKDPGTTHERKRKQCLELKYVAPSAASGNQALAYRCVRWKIIGRDPLPSDNPPEVPVGAGPKPLLGVIPTVATGHAYTSESGGSGGRFWLEARVEGQVIVPGDRVGLYLAPGLIFAADQDDLSGTSLIAGVLVAATARLTLDLHAGKVHADADPWRAGLALRLRPRHHATHDWTLHLGVEHLRGDDAFDVRGELRANQTTGIVIGGSYGSVR